MACCAFRGELAELTDGQLLTALTWGVAALKDVNDLRARIKEQGGSSRLILDNIIYGLCLALVHALGLLAAFNWNI